MVRLNETGTAGWYGDWELSECATEPTFALSIRYMCIRCTAGCCWWLLPRAIGIRSWLCIITRASSTLGIDVHVNIQIITWLVCTQVLDLRLGSVNTLDLRLRLGSVQLGKSIGKEMRLRIPYTLIIVVMKWSTCQDMPPRMRCEADLLTTFREYLQLVLLILWWLPILIISHLTIEDQHSHGRINEVE